MINFITSIAIAIQLLIGQISVHLIEAQALPNHRIWVEIPEPCFIGLDSEYDFDPTDYEDDWTVGLAFYLAELSTGMHVQFLAASTDDAWNRIEKKLWDKEQYKTSVLRISKNEK